MVMNSLQISSPEEELRVAAAPRRELAKRLMFWNFLVTGENRSQSRAQEGVAPTQAASWRGQGASRASRSPGGLWLPSGPSSGPWSLPVHGFSLFLWEFSRTSKYSFSCNQENHTGNSTENSVSPG